MSADWSEFGTASTTLVDTQVSQAVEVGSVLVLLDRETLRAPTKGSTRSEVRGGESGLGSAQIQRAGMELRRRMDSWQNGQIVRQHPRWPLVRPRGGTPITRLKTTRRPIIRPGPIVWSLAVVWPITWS